MDTYSFYQRLGHMSAAPRPLADWHPPLSGDMDCVIKPDGSWHIDGTLVKNRRLITLFASVLRYEQGDYYLVTPVEKWRIQVDDLPFLVVELTVKKQTEQIISVRTNLDDQVSIDAQHQLDVSALPHGETRQRIPYVHIRHGLNARFNRSTFIQLAALLSPGKQADEYMLSSAGEVFTLRL